jgi:hypothetical protein
MLEIVDDVIIPEPEPQAESQTDTTPPDDGAIENQLTQEIVTLWSDHVRLSGSRRATAKELRQIRANLAERLHQMKSLLSRPGRSGQWRSWLRERGINRSTADRLVARHAETLGNHEEDALSGAISNSPEDNAEKVAKAVWLRFRKVLDTHETVIQFLASIAEISGVPHEWRDEGLMIFNPVPRAADGLSGSVSAPEPAPQPSDGGDVDSELLAPETTTAALTTGRAAAVAGADSGDVV